MSLLHLKSILWLQRLVIAKSNLRLGCLQWKKIGRSVSLVVNMKTGFNSLRKPLNHGAEQASNETLKHTQQRN